MKVFQLMDLLEQAEGAKPLQVEAGSWCGREHNFDFDRPRPTQSSITIQSLPLS